MAWDVRPTTDLEEFKRAVGQVLDAREAAEDIPFEPPANRLVEENLWRAIRNGMDGRLIDLETLEQIPHQNPGTPDELTAVEHRDEIQRALRILSDEEREAIGRWQQMSMWRKGLAVGAFAVGTFGLGFTLGGLVFGRWRRAKA